MRYTFPIYETHFESKIKDSVQTIDNPFENESIFLGIDSRATQRRKGKKPRSTPCPYFFIRSQKNSSKQCLFGSLIYNAGTLYFYTGN